MSAANQFHTSLPVVTRTPKRCNLTPEVQAIGSPLGVAVRKARSKVYVMRTRPRVMELKALGLNNRQVAEQLHDEGFITPTGLRFTSVQVNYLVHHPL